MSCSAAERNGHKYDKIESDHSAEDAEQWACTPCTNLAVMARSLACIGMEEWHKNSLSKSGVGRDRTTCLHKIAPLSQPTEVGGRGGRAYVFFGTFFSKKTKRKNAKSYPCKNGSFLSVKNAKSYFIFQKVLLGVIAGSKIGFCPVFIRLLPDFMIFQWILQFFFAGKLLKKMQNPTPAKTLVNAW